MSLMFGFELETVGVPCTVVLDEMRKVLDPIRIEYQHRVGPVPYWSCYPESYLKEDFGEPTCEIRSRVNPTEEEIVKVVRKMRELGARTTRYCGMHVHVSSPDPKYPYLRVALPPTEIWPERVKDAGRKRGRQTYLGKEALGITQIKQNHVEVRVFNSIVDPDYVLSNIRLTLASVQLPKSSLAENEWTSIPVELDPAKVAPQRKPGTQSAARA